MTTMGMKMPGLSTKNVPPIIYKDGDLGCHFGRSAPRVLLRKGNLELWWVSASSHWSGMNGNTRNPSTLIQVMIEDLGQHGKRHKHGNMFFEGGRLSKARVRMWSTAIGAAMEMTGDQVRICASYFTSREPKTVIVEGKK